MNPGPPTFPRGVIGGYDLRMSDFTTEDLFDTTDRVVAELLARNGIADPPVDALALARDVFRLSVRFAEEEDDDSARGRFGARPKPRPRRDEVVLRPESPEEIHQTVCGRAVAKLLVPVVLEKLGVAPGTENKGAAKSLVGLIAPRLLLPTRWFERDARRANSDVWAIKDRYPTVQYEMIGWRLLDLDEACVVAVVDDGEVTARRGNRAAAGKQLTIAETKCLARIAEHGEPVTVRADGWAARGWPVPTGPFNRILLRAVPDEI